MPKKGTKPVKSRIKLSFPILILLAVSIACVGVYLTFFSSAAVNPKGELNDDGKVDIVDLSIMLSNYGKTGDAGDVADTNGDHAVSIIDLSVLLSNYGTNPAIQTTATTTGAEQKIFDWTTQKCENADIPDLPARAFKDASGQVNLIASHYTSRRAVGTSLNNVAHSCDVIMRSNYSPDPAKFDDYEWLAAPYTTDGNTVFALIHNEFHGNERPTLCPSRVYTNCWYNSITLAVSRDGGKTYAHGVGPNHLVASLPYKYVPDLGTPIGYFEPSNIVRHPNDGYYYSLIRTVAYQEQKRGVCVMRTKNLGDPKSWRVWDGKGYNNQFINPYTQTANPPLQTCPVVSYSEIESMQSSFTFNTYLGRFVVTGVTGLWTNGVLVHGVYYSTSSDLIHWSPRKLLYPGPPTWVWKAGGPDPIAYGALLDPASPSRNFETTGQNPYLYFTRMNYSTGGEGTADRDLIRIQVHFEKK